MAVAPSFQPLIVPTIFPVIEEIPLKVLFRNITIDEDTCITWLQNNGLLARGMKCKCGSIMRSGTIAGISEGRGWRCPEKSCRKFASLRTQPIGGPGNVFEIDESKFGHRKYSRGRMLSGQWVFGGIDVDTKDIFMILVQNRTAATLVPLIEQYILPGTCDEWASYNLISSTTFQHLTVNHSIHFVNPTTGVHTQTIEISWGQAKKRMRNSMTTNPELLDTHLAEICWRKKFGGASFSNLIKEIRNQYTVV